MSIKNNRDIARWYDEFYKKFGVFKNETEAKRMLDLLHVVPGRKLLDVAAGGGHLLRLADGLRQRTYGIEISKSAIEVAKTNSPNSTLVRGNAEKLPFPSNTFDYVTCLGSLEHFVHMDKAVREMARVLKDEGLACIYVPNAYFLYHCWAAFRRGAGPSDGQEFERYASMLEWKKLIESNGLAVVEIHKDNTPVVGLLGRLKPFIPTNLSYAFIFICRKNMTPHRI